MRAGGAGSPHGSRPTAAFAGQPRQAEGAASGAAAKLDFGDAPDGEPTGYPNRQLGKFPTKLRSNGARATVGGFHLGPQVDGEVDAHRPAREFHNDGVVLGSGISCGAAELAVLVTLDEPAPAGGKTVHFNFWADFDHSGSWAGGDRCAKEHAVVDAPLTVPAGVRLTIFEVPFEFGSYSSPVWTRSILSRAPLGRRPGRQSGRAVELPMPFYLTGQVSCNGSGTAKPVARRSRSPSLSPLASPRSRASAQEVDVTAGSGRAAGPAAANPNLRGRIKLIELAGAREPRGSRSSGRTAASCRCASFSRSSMPLHRRPASRSGPALPLGRDRPVSLSGGWRNLFTDPRASIPQLCLRLHTSPPVAGGVGRRARPVRRARRQARSRSAPTGRRAGCRHRRARPLLGGDVGPKKGSATATWTTDAEGNCRNARPAGNLARVQDRRPRAARAHRAPAARRWRSSRDGTYLVVVARQAGRPPGGEQRRVTSCPHAERLQEARGDPLRRAGSPGCGSTGRMQPAGGELPVSRARCGRGRSRRARRRAQLIAS